MAMLTDLSLSILKGDSFTTRMEQICQGELPFKPLEGSKYKRILIPGVTGGEVQFALMSFISQALRIRGAEVTTLMCDEFLPACTLRKVQHTESACTRWCHKNSRPFAAAAKLPHRWYSEFITPELMQKHKDIAMQVHPGDIPQYCYRKIEIGQHIIRSLESFYRVDAVDLSEPHIGEKARDFLQASLHLADIGYRIIEELKIDKVILEDGRKTDWGIIRDVARHLGVPVDLVMVAPRGNSLMIERDQPNKPTESMPGWAQWRDIPLSQEQDDQLTEYLSFRQKEPVKDSTFCSWTRKLTRSEVLQFIGISDDLTSQSKVFGLFPNVGYDAGVTSFQPAFRPATEWVTKTIDYFKQWPQHHLIIKTHPAEHMWPTFEPLKHAIEKSCPQLPENIHLIPPDSEITAQGLIGILDVAMVYTSTVAVEAAALGNLVILVGGGWHAGRGITIDTRTPEEYFSILNNICADKQPDMSLELARRYAYAFFFRASLPLEMFTIKDINVSEIHIESLADLAPGRCKTMDLLCRSFLLDEIAQAHEHERLTVSVSN